MGSPENLFCFREGLTQLTSCSCFVTCGEPHLIGGKAEGEIEGHLINSVIWHPGSSCLIKFEYGIVSSKEGTMVGVEC